MPLRLFPRSIFKELNNAAYIVEAESTALRKVKSNIATLLVLIV